MVPLKFQFQIPHYCAHAILRSVAGLNQNTSADVKQQTAVPGEADLKTLFINPTIFFL